MRVFQAACAAGLVWIVSAATGCGMLGLTGEQCQTTADCTARGPAFTGFVCGPESTCVQPAKGGSGPIAAVDVCESTDKCTAANGGRPSVCRTPGKDPCINIATEACPIVEGTQDQWSDPNAVFFGAISQARTKDVAGVQYGRALEAGMTLGIREYMNAVGGLQGADNKPRPLVGVYCSVEGLAPPDERDAAVVAAVRHLTTTVNAAAIFTQDEHMAVPARPAALEAGVFHVCPFCETLVPSDTNGLEWHGLQSWDSAVLLYNKMIEVFEGKIRANPAYNLAPGEPIRVAVSSSNTNEYVGTSGDAITDQIKFNGKLLSEQDGSSLFLRTNVSSWLSPDNSAQSYVAAQKIAAFKPHIVITANDLEGGRLIIPLVEALWQDGQPPPYYISNVVPSEQAFFNTLTSDEQLRLRFGGVTPSNDPDGATLKVQAAFIARVRTVFEEANVPPVIELVYAGVVYDSFLSTVLAVSASQVTTGLKAGDIRIAMGRLVGSDGQTAMNLDPTGLKPIVSALAAGGNVELLGTFGKIRWDVNAHQRQGYNASYCAIRDTQSGNAVFGDLGPYQLGNTVDPSTSFSCF